MKFALDTNILIYFDDSAEPTRRAEARRLLRRIPAESIVIPAQVLGEYVRVLLRKQGYSPNEAREMLSVWAGTYAVVDTGSSIVTAAADLTSSHPISFWDAVVLSAAASAGCDYLVSEDMGNGFSWSGVTVVNPFASLLDPRFESAIQG